MKLTLLIVCILIPVMLGREKNAQRQRGVNPGQKQGLKGMSFRPKKMPAPKKLAPTKPTLKKTSPKITGEFHVHHNNEFNYNVQAPESTTENDRQLKDYGYKGNQKQELRFFPRVFPFKGGPKQTPTKVTPKKTAHKRPKLDHDYDLPDDSDENHVYLHGTWLKNVQNKSGKNGRDIKFKKTPMSDCCGSPGVVQGSAAGLPNYHYQMPPPQMGFPYGPYYAAPGSVGTASNVIQSGVMTNQWGKQEKLKMKDAKQTQGFKDRSRVCILNAYQEYCVGQEYK